MPPTCSTSRGSRRRGAAGGEQVVDDQHALARLDGILVDLQAIGAIFQLVAHAHAFGGKLLRLAHGHESRAQGISQRRRENEAARFDAQHLIDGSVLIMRLQPVDHAAESVFVLQQRGDVVEENARFGKVGHFADEFLEIAHEDGNDPYCCTRRAVPFNSK